MAVLAVALIGMAGAANYMYEKASVKGVGYKNVEMIISTQKGFNGSETGRKGSGSGNVITERTELEAERQLEAADGSPIRGNTSTVRWPFRYELVAGQLASLPMDYINFTKEAEFEYMPVSYQTGTYDQKWVRNSAYRIM